MRAFASGLSTLYRERRAFRWAVELLGFALIVLAISAWQTRHHLRGAAPAVRLSTLDGAATSLPAVLRDGGGKRTLVYVWAPWCTVCKAESQNVAWVRSMVGERARVLSIASGWDRPDEVRSYVSEHGVEYPVLLGDESVARALRVQAFPTIYFLDADGRISSSVSGYTTTAGLLLRLFAP